MIPREPTQTVGDGAAMAVGSLDCVPRGIVPLERNTVAEKPSRELKPGDRVEWKTSQGKTSGRVVKKQTSRMKIKGHDVAASRTHPEYLVQSEKSGKRAAHQANALKKKSREGR